MLTAALARDVPLEMIHEIAFGIEAPSLVAKRHGYEPAQYQALEQQEWFTAAIEQRRAQLAVEGVTFRTKARMMAEDGLEKLYVMMKSSTKPDTVLEMVKYLSKMADLEPKPNEQVQTGTPFSITIQLPTVATQVNIANPLHTVEADVLDVRPEYLTNWTPPSFPLAEAAE